MTQFDLNVYLAVSSIKPNEAMERSRCRSRTGAAFALSTKSLWLTVVEVAASVVKTLRSIPI